jgi:hypothetical protein
MGTSCCGTAVTESSTAWCGLGTLSRFSALSYRAASDEVIVDLAHGISDRDHDREDHEHGQRQAIEEQEWDRDSPAGLGNGQPQQQHARDLNRQNSEQAIPSIGITS